MRHGTPAFLLSLTALLSTLCLTSAQRVEAQEPTTARLDYVTSDDQCPSAEVFSDEVSARIGRLAFVEGGPRTVVIRAVRMGEEAMVTVEFEGQTRVFRDAHCSVAAEAAASAVGVWLDPPQQVYILGRIEDGAWAGEDPREAHNTAPESGQSSQDEDTVTVQVTSNLDDDDDDEWSFHIETNTGRGQIGAHFFRRLCLLPCETRVPRGVHQFGLGQGTAPPYPLRTLTEITQDSRIDIQMRRASPLNLAARWMFVIVGLVGLPMSIATLIKRDDWGNAAMAATVGTTAALIVGGSMMWSFSDGGGVDVNVSPL